MDSISNFNKIWDRFNEREERSLGQLFPHECVPSGSSRDNDCRESPLFRLLSLRHNEVFESATDGKTTFNNCFTQYLTIIRRQMIHCKKGAQ